MRTALRSVACLALIGIAAVLPASSHAGLHHGLELQGGISQYTLDSGLRGSSESRWSPVLGAGWYFESGPCSGFRLGTGLSYRRVGDEIYSQFNFLGTGYTSQAFLMLDQVVLPLRVEWSVHQFGRLGIEAGAQFEYALKGMEQVQGGKSVGLQSSRPTAQIFENLRNTFEITSALRRLGGAATAGASLRGRLCSHDAAFFLRYAHGLTRLWRDSDADRYERLATASLRVAW